MDFVAGYNCRRIIMDRVMNGRMNRIGCEEGEEQCDVCQRIMPKLPTLRDENELDTLDSGFGDSGIGKSMSSQVQESTMPSSPLNMPSSPVSEDGGFINHSPIPSRFPTIQDDIEMQTIFEQQQRERQWLASSITRQRREEGQEIAEFEEALRKWANRCPLCKLQKRQDQQHRLEDCPYTEAEEFLSGVRIMTQEI
jgi:hypothetical protein